MVTIIGIILVIIIVLQIYFFLKNKEKMQLFSSIFEKHTTWQIKEDEDDEQIAGIIGDGNHVFMTIINSINKYLGSNRGAVIDYALMKDAVDRNCNSLEDEITTQIPVPLYLGLVGTMLGIIYGILTSGINNDISDTSVSSLLIGVACAMAASACGIILTIIANGCFKKCKNKEESGKNTFLSWLQSELLPALPSSPANALTQMVRNLNKFNGIFAQNTKELGSTLNKVNEEYGKQAEIIEEVRKMNFTEMVRANVRTTNALNNTIDRFRILTDNIDKFSTYLEKLNEFTEKLNQEINRLQILEGINVSMTEIKDFYSRHKGEIVKDTADTQDALNQALHELREASARSIADLQRYLTQQTDTLQLNFNEAASVMINDFQAQLHNMPSLEKRLEDISQIPSALNAVVQRIMSSNAELTKRMADDNAELVRGIRELVIGIRESNDNLLKGIGNANATLLGRIETNIEKLHKGPKPKPKEPKQTWWRILFRKRNKKSSSRTQLNLKL